MVRWLCLLCVALLALTAVRSARAAAAPKVKIDTGAVTGKSEGKVDAFLGIPYAAPPVGDLRWKPPMPAAKWGDRDATKFGSRCMQTDVFHDMVFRDPGISEDCLYLNVWAPAKSSGKKLPVMVWIYGAVLAPLPSSARTAPISPSMT
jgi:para-nitrobenzyl esterase